MPTWYCREGQYVSGPFTDLELERKYHDGDLDVDAELWHSGLSAPIAASAADFIPHFPPGWKARSKTPPSYASVQEPHPLVPRWLLLTLIAGSSAAAVWALLHFTGAAARLTQRQLVFVLELGAFFGMWIVYFMSRHAKAPRLFRVLTLRRLLRTTAATWDQTANSDLGGQFRDKASTTITAAALFVGVAGVALGQVSSAYQDWHATKPAPGYCWELVILSAAALAAFMALTCFIVSVDSLDSTFNRFALRAKTPQLRAHFYMSTINPRYFGFVSLLTSAVLLLGFREPLLGCTAIGLLVGIGYPHWFPPLNVLEPINPNVTLSALARDVVVFVLRMTALVAAPILYCAWR